MSIGEKGTRETNSATYQRQHKHLREVRGQAREHKCRCGEQAVHWSYQHDTDPEDINNYEPMCRVCHQAYDTPEWLIQERAEERARIEQTNAFKGWTPERREAQRQRMLDKWSDPEARAKQAEKTKREKPWLSRRLMSGGGL